MDKNSNFYTITYAAILTVVVAVILAFVNSSLSPRMEANQKLATQEDILRSVGLTDLEDAASVYEKTISSIVIDSKGNVLDGISAEEVVVADEFKKPENEQKHPLYIYTDENGSKRYIVPLYGNGLWDKIWGYMSIQEDLNTIAGISMDHRGETPGLGAEIKDSPEQYNDPYIGKKLYNDSGEFVAVSMVKGGIKEPDHQVDAISGATITSDGVNEMVYRGVDYYLEYFNSLQTQTSSK